MGVGPCRKQASQKSQPPAALACADALMLAGFVDAIAALNFFRAVCFFILSNVTLQQTNVGHGARWVCADSCLGECVVYPADSRVAEKKRCWTVTHVLVQNDFNKWFL